MATLSYANPGSGPSAGGIGWINFGVGFSLAPGASVAGVSASLSDGSTLTFNISNTAVSGGGRTVAATATNPAYPFGTAGYTGLTGNVSILTQSSGGQYGTTITLSNISVTDTNGNPVTNYSFILADSQVTLASTEGQQWITNGGLWQQLTFIGNTASPSVTGVGTSTVSLVGTSSGSGGTPLIATTSPTTIQAYLHGQGGNEGVAFGIAINKVQINKVITSRYDTRDQFNLSITGTPSNTATTSGSTIGLQPISANVYGLVGNTYSINETMSPGSYGSLANYITTVEWSNLAAGGTVGPSPGALGDSVTVALGDVLIATITNTVNPNPPNRGISFI